MVPSALEVNDGAEVRFVLESLAIHYKVYADVLDCWRYGDPTARSRLFIIALRKDVFHDVEWVWPDHACDNSWYPIARDIAVPDDQVPPSFWRHES